MHKFFCCCPDDNQLRPAQKNNNFQLEREIDEDLNRLLRQRKPTMKEQYIQVDFENEPEERLQNLIVNIEQMENANENIINQLQQETINLLILLEQLKLELCPLLPKISQIIQKTKGKTKPGLQEKTKAKIMRTLSNVKNEVFQEYGISCDIMSEDELEERIGQMGQIEQVSELYKQLKEATALALTGEDPNLSIFLEDENLDYDVYQQIISKIYSVIRYSLYQGIKEMTNNFQIMLNENELKDVVKSLDIEKVRQDVFKLYKIKPGLDTQLSLRKVQYLYSDDEMFQNYLKCLKEAHDRFLAYIFQYTKFQKMEQNPLHSQDLNYGVPNLFTEILDSLLDDTHQVLADEYQQNQIRKFASPKNPNRSSISLKRNGSQSSLKQNNLVSAYLNTEENDELAHGRKKFGNLKGLQVATEDEENKRLMQTSNSNQFLNPPTFNLKGSFLKLSPTATMTGRPRGKVAFFPKEKENKKQEETVYMEELGDSDLDQQALMFRGQADQTYDDEDEEFDIKLNSL